MFAICIESSHARGMGHLYRSINLADQLRFRDLSFVFLINRHEASIKVLEQNRLPYRVVNLEDHDAAWESDLIDEFKIQIWINDRLDTDKEHASRVKACGIPLVTFDDRGQGASFADLHIAGLVFGDNEELEGCRVLSGESYLLLNPEIADHKRLRTELNSIVVSLGGSDTFGVTVDVVRLLAQNGYGATVVVGPSFEHFDELRKVATSAFAVKQGVPSLIEEFGRHDLAITGGGITPFEANAAGLPVVVVANEVFEVPVGEKLEELGGAIFVGHYTKIDASRFHDLGSLPIEEMSRTAMEKVSLRGCSVVVDAILELIPNE